MLITNLSSQNFWCAFLCPLKHKVWEHIDLHTSIRMYARKLLQCVQLLLHLLRDYDKHFTDGRPKCVVVQDAKQFISGQFLLDYGPRLVFTIYTYNGNSIVCPNPCPWLLDFNPFCNKFPFVGALESGGQVRPMNFNITTSWCLACSRCLMILMFVFSDRSQCV